MKTHEAHYHMTVPVKLRGKSIERQVDHRVVQKVFLSTDISDDGTVVADRKTRSLVSPPLPHMDARTLATMYNYRGIGGGVALMVASNINLTCDHEREDHGFPIIY